MNTAGQSDTPLGVPGIIDAIPIGRGGFGAVYRGHQVEFGRDVAVKVLHGVDLSERTRVRFDRERLAMGAVSGHPHIVTILDAGLTTSGVPYIVMELMPGGTLQQRIARGGPLPLAGVLDIGIKLAGALETAHRAGVLHLDVKPENILLSEYGEPQLADFGIARLAGTGTRSAMVTASIAHAAPEVLGEQDPTFAADVYSLASTLYALTTGRAPHVGDDDRLLAALIARVLTADPPPILDVPARFSEVLGQALAKDPSSRFASALAFGQALREVGDGLGLLLPQPPVADSVRREFDAGLTPLAPGPTAPRAPVESVAETIGLDEYVAAQPPSPFARTAKPTSEASPPRRRPSNRALAGLVVGAVAILIGLAALVITGDRTADTAAQRTTGSPRATAGDGLLDVTPTTTHRTPTPAGPSPTDDGTTVVVGGTPYTCDELLSAVCSPDEFVAFQRHREALPSYPLGVASGFLNAQANAAVALLSCAGAPTSQDADARFPAFGVLTASLPKYLTAQLWFDAVGSLCPEIGEAYVAAPMRLWAETLLESGVSSFLAPANGIDCGYAEALVDELSTAGADATARCGLLLSDDDLLLELAGRLGGADGGLVFFSISEPVVREAIDASGYTGAVWVVDSINSIVRVD